MQHRGTPGRTTTCPAPSPGRTGTYRAAEPPTFCAAATRLAAISETRGTHPRFALSPALAGRRPRGRVDARMPLIRASTPSATSSSARRRAAARTLRSGRPRHVRDSVGTTARSRARCHRPGGAPRQLSPVRARCAASPTRGTRSARPTSAAAWSPACFSWPMRSRPRRQTALVPMRGCISLQGATQTAFAADARRPESLLGYSSCHREWPGARVLDSERGHRLGDRRRTRCAARADRPPPCGHRPMAHAGPRSSRRRRTHLERVDAIRTRHGRLVATRGDLTSNLAPERVPAGRLAQHRPARAPDDDARLTAGRRSARRNQPPSRQGGRCSIARGPLELDHTPGGGVRSAPARLLAADERARRRGATPTSGRATMR